MVKSGEVMHVSPRQTRFQAQQTVRIGKKFRIAFPSMFRERLGEKVIVTYWFEQSLFATSEKKWGAVLKKELEDKSFLSSKVRDLRRFLLGGVSNVAFDPQGRFVIPEYLRKHAQLQVDEEATFIWQEEYVEIWNKKRWEAREAEVIKNISAIANEFGQVERQNG